MSFKKHLISLPKHTFKYHLLTVYNFYNNPLEILLLLVSVHLSYLRKQYDRFLQKHSNFPIFIISLFMIAPKMRNNLFRNRLIRT